MRLFKSDVRVVGQHLRCFRHIGAVLFYRLTGEGIVRTHPDGVASYADCQLCSVGIINHASFSVDCLVLRLLLHRPGGIFVPFHDLDPAYTESEKKQHREDQNRDDDQVVFAFIPV